MRVILRKIVVSIFIVSLVSFSGGCSSTPASQLMVGHEAPLTQLYSIGGDQLTLDDYQGKEVVLLFWAQWCSRSRGFISALAEAAPKLKHKGIALVAVNIDTQEKFGTVHNMIEENELGSIDHMFSGNDVSDPAFVAFGCREVPTVFILNKQHKVVVVGNSFDVVEEFYKLDADS